MAGVNNVTVGNQLNPPYCQVISVDYVAPLSISNPVTLDLTNQVVNGSLNLFQAIYVDNSANASSVTIGVRGTSFQLVVKARTQGWYPVVCPVGQGFFTFTSAGGVNVPVQILNAPMPVAQWSTV